MFGILIAITVSVMLLKFFGIAAFATISWGLLWGTFGVLSLVWLVFFFIAVAAHVASGS